MTLHAVKKAKDQLMEQEKREQRGKPGSRSRPQSRSQMSLSDQETRAKATIKDIDELYSALQGLVPKPGQQQQQRQKQRGTTSETDTDTTRDFEESDGSQKTNSTITINDNRGRKTGNMKSIEKILDIESKENNQVFPDDRIFASDTELELSSPYANDHHRHVRRHTSLPAYNDESANEMIDDETAPKRSKFLIFRRRRRRRAPKQFNKKQSSWRSLLASLNFTRKSATKVKKKSKNSPLPSRKGAEQRSSGTPSEQRHEKITKKVSSTHENGVQKTPPTLLHRRPSVKPKAPEPPVQDNVDGNDNFLENIMKVRSDKVKKKLSAWYKHVLEETTSLNVSSPARYSRSCENLFTDSEFIRAGRTYSSETESTETTDIRSRVNLNKIRVRKSRAKRNRRKERERWQSLPNVKLVSCALNEANKKSDRSKSTGNEPEKELPVVPNQEKKKSFPTEYNPTVKPVEAKLSFGNSLEKEKSRESPINDFMMIRKENSSSWLSRQCSKTTIGCIRPLQLNLFYSESPSREAKFRSKPVSVKPKFQFNGTLVQSKPLCLETTESLQSSAFKVRQTSSQRRRKRRSLKRQPRLPHQSPFYSPQNNTSCISPTKLHFNGISKENSMYESPPAKDSRLGSRLDNDENVFRVEPINTGERLTPKHYSESEDSGWASMDKTPASHTDTAIQTEPVIVVTAASKPGSLLLLDLFNGSIGQSEA